MTVYSHAKLTQTQLNKIDKITATETEPDKILKQKFPRYRSIVKQGIYFDAPPYLYAYPLRMRWVS